MNQFQLDMATIKIAIESVDTNEFKSTLSSTKTPIPQLIDQDSVSLFHILASDKFLKESESLLFLDILLDEYSARYFDDSAGEIKDSLNIKTEQDKFTPLMLAVFKNRRVILT